MQYAWESETHACACICMYHVCQQVPVQLIHNDESQEAFKYSDYFSKVSDESVVL